MDPKAPKTGRAESRARARSIILDATEALLAEGGQAGFSIRRLVERSGYAAPSIYHYFGDKQGLLHALLERCFGRLVEELRRIPGRPEDPIAETLALSRSFVRFGLDHPEHYRVLFAARERPEAAPPPAAEQAREILEGPIRALAARGGWRTDVATVRQATWALLHGVVSLQTSRPDVDWVPDLLEVSLEAMLRGLLDPSAATDP